MSNPKVFISYGTEDRSWAKSFAEALSRRSVDVWFDIYELSPSQNIQTALIDALKKSDIYAVVIGKRRLASPDVMFEIGVAAATGRPVIPIILQEAATPDLLSGFAHIQTVRTDDPEHAADELKRVADDIARKA
jgi:nucleoside 2-deoxyribosyltransferase